MNFPIFQLIQFLSNGVIPENLIKADDISKTEYIFYNFHTKFNKDDPSDTHLIILYKLGEFFACFVNSQSLVKNSEISNGSEYLTIFKFNDENDMMELVNKLRFRKGHMFKEISKTSIPKNSISN